MRQRLLYTWQVRIKDKLEFRFNIREKGDKFFVFLHALLHVYRPKPCVDIVENQQMVVDIVCESGMQLDN